MKFLFDLFPVILFFLTYKLTSHGKSAEACLISSDVNASLLHEPILIATVVAIVATVFQVAWVLAKGRKVEKLLWVSFGIIVVFGGATLYFRDPSFIQWKPTILNWAIAGFLIFSTIFGRNPIREAMQEQIQLPETVWSRLNFAWMMFFIVVGLANVVAIKLLSCSDWVSFKLYGLMGLSLSFVIAQAIVISKYVEE